MIRVGLSPSLRGELENLFAARAGIALEPALTRADVVVASALELDDLPPATPCVLLSDGPVPAGVRAVLPLAASDDQIVAAIYAVAAGLSVVAPSAPDPVVQAEALTAREVQVLRLAAAGLANKQIANRLGISDHTVKFHLAGLMGKLGAASRTEAVTLGIRRGLVLL
ncbi:MAG: response regulator transcription factor [Terriglobales bacterium]